MAPETYAVVSTLDMTLHAAPLVFDNATAADQAVAQLDRRAARADRRGAGRSLGTGEARRMSARYTFLPWMRRGLSNQIKDPAGAGLSRARLEVARHGRIRRVRRAVGAADREADQAGRTRATSPGSIRSR